MRKRRRLLRLRRFHLLYGRSGFRRIALHGICRDSRRDVVPTSNAVCLAQTRVSAIDPFPYDRRPTKDSRKVLMATAPLFRRMCYDPASIPIVPRNGVKSIEPLQKTCKEHRLARILLADALLGGAAESLGGCIFDPAGCESVAGNHYALGGSMVSAMRCFLISTSTTHTLTISPTLSASLGCLMKRLEIRLMCTSPS